MGLLVLVLGLILFLGPHAFTAQQRHRAAVVEALGEGPYKVLFSVVALAGLYLTGKGFSLYYDAGPVDVWYPPRWTRHLTETLMLPVCVCVAASFLPGRISQTLKHPLLVAAKTWALAHLLTNGDLGGMILFAAVLAWAVYDRISLKRRKAAVAVAVPKGLANDIAAVVAGLILYAALFFPFHTFVIGRPLLATAFGT